MDTDNTYQRVTWEHVSHIKERRTEPVSSLLVRWINVVMRENLGVGDRLYSTTEIAYTGFRLEDFQ